PNRPVKVRRNDPNRGWLVSTRCLGPATLAGSLFWLCVLPTFAGGLGPDSQCDDARIVGDRLSYVVVAETSHRGLMEHSSTVTNVAWLPATRGVGGGAELRSIPPYYRTDLPSRRSYVGYGKPRSTVRKTGSRATQPQTDFVV